jgi:hypothetical protein
VGRGLELRPPEGAPLAARIGDVSIQPGGATIAECRVTFHVEPEAYDRIVAESLFHLTPAARSSAGAAFTALGEVEIHARLDSELLELWPARATDAEAAHDLIGQTPRLSETESWFAARVQQLMPLPPDLAAGGASVKTGYRTSWDRSDERSSDAPTLLFPVVLQALRSLGWPFEVAEEGAAVQLQHDGPYGQWPMAILAEEEFRQCVVYSYSPVEVPPDRRLAVAELLTRANYGLRIGNFEMDLGDGEVRYKTSIDVTGDRLSQALVEHLLAANVAQMGRYLPGVVAVVEQGGRPEAVIETIEAS